MIHNSTNWVLSIAFAVLSTFLIFNFGYVVYYLSGIHVSIIGYQGTSRFIAYFAFTYLMCLRKNKPPFYVIAIPFLLIDSTALFEGLKLFPYRFPYLSVFSILGTLTGLQVRKNRKAFVKNAITSIAFIVFAQLFVNKWMVALTEEINKPEVSAGIFQTASVLTVDSLPVSFSQLVTDKPTLINFYFVGCPACEKKFVYLKKLRSIYRNDQLNIIKVCIGSTTEFAKYRRHFLSKMKDSIPFYYATTSVSQKLELQEFPTEIFLYKGKIENVFVGFGDGPSWLEMEKKLIGKLME